MCAYSMASTIIQVYLKHILEAFFHMHPNVRMSALSVIILVLKQGLVHPVQVITSQYLYVGVTCVKDKFSKVL